MPSTSFAKCLDDYLIHFLKEWNYLIEAFWIVMILLNQGSPITSISRVISKINIRYFHNLYLTQITTCCQSYLWWMQWQRQPRPMSLLVENPETDTGLGHIAWCSLCVKPSQQPGFLYSIFLAKTVILDLPLKSIWNILSAINSLAFE